MSYLKTYQRRLSRAKAELKKAIDKNELETAFKIDEKIKALKLKILQLKEKEWKKQS